MTKTGSNLPVKHSKLKTISKFIDVGVLTLLVIFFVGFIAFDHEYIGIHEHILILPHDTEPYFDAIPLIIFGLLAIDLYLKYRILDSTPREFVKHYWLDLIMAMSIPILLPLKFISVTLRLFKLIKVSKFGYKGIQKINKVIKHLSPSRKSTDHH